MVMDKDLTWGGEHTIQCTDDVLQNCALETCTVLLTSVTSISSIKRKESHILETTLLLATMSIQITLAKKKVGGSNILCLGLQCSSVHRRATDGSR